MSNEEFSGYKGKALKVIKNANAEIGDIIIVKVENKTFEGILIPRSEHVDDKHIVIKLQNGYNIGIHVSSDMKIEKSGAGTKPVFTAPPSPKQNSKLPRITIMSTGGTIASRVDYRTGAVRPALTASDLYSVVPELSELARIKTQILLNLFSENLKPQHWTEIARATVNHISNGAEGIVIAHGTDTMGYTAAALSFALQNLPVPVLIVGSQRSADRPSSDAATNLIGAVDSAANAPFAEVAVVMHETPSDRTLTIHRGTKVRKCHTSRRDAFKSVNSTPMARIQNGKIRMLTDDYKERNYSRKIVLKPEFDEKVALLKFYPSMDPALIDWHLERGYRGIIIEGTGLGHINKESFEAIQRAIEQDVIVAMTSQCIWGRVNMNVYDSGRDLLALGVVSLEDMLSETALVKLMWASAQTKDQRKAVELLKTNVAGEFSSRTLFEEKRNG